MKKMCIRDRLDFEHRKIYHSQNFVDMNETSIDYYRKKVEKALNSPTMKELTVGSLHEMMLRCEKMVESDEEFIKQAHEKMCIRDSNNTTIFFNNNTM